jgi:HEAT repeat protein
MSARRSSLAAAAACAALLLAGCPKDPYDPATWVDKLDDQDPAERAEAVTHLQQLKDPAAIKPLGEFWRKNNRPSKVLRIIIDLASYVDAEKKTGPNWAPAIPYLVEAIENADYNEQGSIDDASVAADALGEAAAAGQRDAEAVQVLISASNKKLRKQSPGHRVRIAAARALGRFGADQRIVDTLVAVLETDAKQQPVKVNAAAANALGDTGSPKAVGPLIKAAYAQPLIYQQARASLSAIGRPVIPELIRVLEGKHDALNAFAKENNFANNCEKGEGPETTCRAPGNLEFKAASILGDLRAAEAVPLLTAGLSKPARTSFFDPETGSPGPPTHNAYLEALSQIGAPQAADAIYAYWSNPATDDALRPIAMDKYSKLSRDTKGLPQLAKMFEDEAEEENVRLAAALSYGRLVRKQSELAPLDAMIKKFQKPADENDAKAKKAKTEQERADFENKRDSYRGYQVAFEENKERALVGIKCQDDPACYVEYLKATDIAVGKPGLPRAERALLELAKLGPKAASAVPALLQHAESPERIMREGVLLALTSVAPKPCPDCVARLAEVVEKQKDQTTLDLLTGETKIVMNYFKWAGSAGGGGGAAPAPTPTPAPPAGGAPK